MRLAVFVVIASLGVLRFVGALTYKGADFSSLALVEKAGHSFSTGGSKKPLETILAAQGCNAARIRVWTAGDYNLAYGLALGKRAKAAGMKVVVDLHFSDTWADPSHQAIPSSWGGSSATLSSLNSAIYDYTKYVVQQFSAQGTPVDVLQVGNEINDGLLWPVGRISTMGFTPASQLLHSAIAGAMAAGSPKIALHLANGWDWLTLKWWFSGIFVKGALASSELSMIGVSFYPFFDAKATVSNLKTSLTNLVALTGKDVLVMETNWPVACAGVTMSEPSIPVSAAGQETWISDIKSTLVGLSGSHGVGIFYWEPAWVGNAALGSKCSDNLLVDYSGPTRASVSIYKNM